MSKFICTKNVVESDLKKHLKFEKADFDVKQYFRSDSHYFEKNRI